MEKAVNTPNNNESSFKFVDRRRFDETGEARETTDEMRSEEPAKAQAQKVEAPKAESPAAPAAAPTDAENVDPTAGPITFSLFLQSLAQQAIMSMGLIPWPDTGETHANFDHARETIDILAILHEKTKGNLTASEQRFFDTVLHELRVTFVELLKGGGAR